MLKYNKILKISALVFCAGILLGGIGTGIAIAEYTSLEYTGQHILGEEYMKTENLDVTVVPETGKKIEIAHHYQTRKVSYDESIPMDTIRYVVTYNTELMVCQPNYDKYEAVVEESWNEDDDSWETDIWEREDEAHQEPEYQGRVSLEWRYIGDDFDTTMRNKDKILNDLKNGKIGSYQTKGIDSIEIWMNPGMKDFVEFE